jgi:hypothetical protein
MGLLIVGLTRHRGLAVTAGLIANQSVLSWRGAKGEPRQASYQGCQTQQQESTMPHEFHLANANLAAIGGWVRAFLPHLLPTALRLAYCMVLFMMTNLTLFRFLANAGRSTDQTR